MSSPSLRRTLLLALAAATLTGGGAHAQSRGSGSGKSLPVYPPTRNTGTRAQASEVRSDAAPGFDPRKGFMGTLGAGQDQLGPDRLGVSAAVDRSLDQARGQATTTGEMSTWRAGEGVRSWTSQDVRQARRQQAPDLAWAAGQGPKDTKAAPAPAEQTTRDRAPPARAAGEKPAGN